jgi:hypothetical protein
VQYFENEEIPDEDRPESAIPKSDEEAVEEEDANAGKKGKKESASAAKGGKGKKAAVDGDVDEKEEKPKKGAKKVKVSHVSASCVVELVVYGLNMTCMAFYRTRRRPRRSLLARGNPLPNVKSVTVPPVLSFQLRSFNHSADPPRLIGQEGRE